MRQALAPLAAGLCAILLGYGMVWAQSSGPVTIQPDESRSVEGAQGCPVTYTAQDGNHGMLKCGGAPEMHEGVPICADHNPTAWHALVQRDGAGAVVCTYGHEHHADPNSVNDIFGPPSAWYGGTQSISYPWQTSSALGLENHAKHEGYKWTVYRDMECKPYGNQPGCMRAFRAQVHMMGTASDAVTRFHSFSFETLIEYQGRQGIIRHGGWIDGGHLALNVDGGGSSICPAGEFQPIPLRCRQSGNRRHHNSTNVPAPHTPHNALIASWYPGHSMTGVALSLEEFGPVDYADPTRQTFSPPEMRANNSRGAVGEASANPRGPQDMFVPLAVDGLLTFQQYTNRAGVPAQGCASPAVDCVPFRAEHVPAVLTFWNGLHQGIEWRTTDYDVQSPVTGKSLIRFPN